MKCPYCGSSHVRKAAAVYAEGANETTYKGRGVGFGIGVSKGGKGAGAGLFGEKGVGRSLTIAAKKADKERILWWGPQATFGLFLILCIIFLIIGLNAPFSKALFVSVAVMIGSPLLTGIHAYHANKDYDLRWYCDSCGDIWTEFEP